MERAAGRLGGYRAASEGLEWYEALGLGLWLLGCLGLLCLYVPLALLLSFVVGVVTSVRDALQQLVPLLPLAPQQLLRFHLSSSLFPLSSCVARDAGAD